MYLHVVNPIIGLMLNVFIQVISSRYHSSLTLLKSLIVGFTFGLMSVIALELYVFSVVPVSVKEAVCTVIANLMIYAALGYCYFHFINLGETARRPRILRELYETQDGLSLKEILERYNAKHIVNMRIQRLIHTGQIIDQHGKYYIGSPVMLFIAKSITTMKLFVLGKRSEFD